MKESPLKKLVEATGDYIKALNMVRGDAPEMITTIKFDTGPSLTYYFRDFSVKMKS